MNLYGLNGNDAVNHIDSLGHMTQDDIRQEKRKLEDKYKDKCCWFFCNHLNLKMDLNGYVDAGNPKSIVWGQVTPHFDACVAEVHYFWWTCYHGSEENPTTVDPHLFGWEAYDSTKYFYAANPGIWGSLGWEPPHSGDPLHIAMEVQALVVVCYEGKYSVQQPTVDRGLQWTWDGHYQQWSGPADEPGAIGQQ